MDEIQYLFRDLFDVSGLVDLLIKELNKAADAGDRYTDQVKKQAKTIADTLTKAYTAYSNGVEGSVRALSEAATDSEYFIKANKDVADSVSKSVIAFKKSKAAIIDVSKGTEELANEYDKVKNSVTSAAQAAGTFNAETKSAATDLLNGAVPSIEQLRNYLNEVYNTYNKLDEASRMAAFNLLHDLEDVASGSANLDNVVSNTMALVQSWEEIQHGAQAVDEATHLVDEAGQRAILSLQKLTETDMVAADSIRGLNEQLGTLVEQYQLLSESERSSEVGTKNIENIKLFVLELENAQKILRETLNPKNIQADMLKATLSDQVAQLNDYKQLASDLEVSYRKAYEAFNDMMQQAQAAGSPVNLNLEFIDEQLNMEGLVSTLDEAIAAREEYRASIDKALGLQEIENNSIKDLQHQVGFLRDVYNSLTASERMAFGDEVLGGIVRVNEQLDTLKTKMKSVLNPPEEGPAEGSIASYRQKIRDLRREIEGLPDLNSALGLQKRQELQEAEDALKALNAELKGTKEELTELDKLRARIVKAQQHNIDLDNEEYIELQKQLNAVKAERKEKELVIKLRAAEANSMEALETQYKLYKIALDKIPISLRGARDYTIMVDTAQGKLKMTAHDLGTEMDTLRQKIRVMHESFGDYTMNVGNYARTFDGLTFSIVQVVRELPAATVNLNTFFLAISNNIPMVIDEINSVRMLAKAQGKEVPSVMKVISGAFKSGMFWLNMLVVVALTLLSKSDKILDFFENLALKIKGIDTQKALKAINDEVKSGAKEFGKAYTSFITLKQGYEALRTEAEKQTWIKNHKSDFHELGVSITNLEEAENLFVKQSDNFVKALLKQAMAAVALKAAQGKLEESFAEYLQSELSIEQMGEYLKKAGYDIGENFGDAVAKGYYDKAKADIAKYEDEFSKRLGGTYGGTGLQWAQRRQGAPDEVEQAYRAVDAYEKSEKAREKANKKNQEAVNILKLQTRYAEEYNITLDEANIKQADLEDPLRKTRNLVRDIGKYIDDTHLKVTKLFDDIYEEGQDDPLVKQFAKIEHDYKEKSEQLINIVTDTQRKLAANTKTLTADQIKKIREIGSMATAALELLTKNYNRQKELWEADVNIRSTEVVRKRTAAELEATRGNIEGIYELRRRLIMAEMRKELLENSKLTEREKIDEADIIAKWNLKLLDLNKEYADKTLAIRKDLNDATLAVANEYSQEAYKAQLDNINIGFTQEVNKILTAAGVNYADILETYSKINAEEGTNAANAFLNNYIQVLTDEETRNALRKALNTYQKNVNETTESYQTKNLDLTQQVELSRLPSGSSLQRTMMETRHQIESLELQLRQAEVGIINLNEEQKEILRNQAEQLKRTLASARLNYFSQYGMLGGILANIAPAFFGDDQLNALEQAKQQVINSINEILEAEIQVRQREKELAEEKVAEAKSAYEKEIEARNNGYAHSVDTAKRELLLQQKTLQKKQIELEKAERAKAAVDSLSQASSLTTATAELWSAFAPMGIPGIVLAAVSTAAMFTAFIASKVKAAQLTSNYGKGGLEFLNGGSHASGNDIDLQTKNSRGRNMRAEGGEALAIINRRSTAKYKSILPGLVSSLNKGTYTFGQSDSINSVQQIIQPGVNLNNIESSLSTLVKQNKKQVYEFGNTTVIVNGNTRTIVRRYNN